MQETTPVLTKGQWITLGASTTSRTRDAVVSHVYSEGGPCGACAEVVYMSDLGEAINDDVKWVGVFFEFAMSGPSGGYAKNSERLAPFVAKLKRGRLADG